MYRLAGGCIAYKHNDNKTLCFYKLYGFEKRYNSQYKGLVLYEFRNVYKRNGYI